MARKKTTPTLIETLAAKANDLDDLAGFKSDEATSLAQLAAEAKAAADTAFLQAEAVDKAVAILSEAGVTV